VVGDGGLDVGDGGMTVVGDGDFEVAEGADVEDGEVLAAVVGPGLTAEGGVVAFFPPHPDSTTATMTARTRITDARRKATISVPSVSPKLPISKPGGPRVIPCQQGGRRG
jgi:hypothetical protein